LAIRHDHESWRIAAEVARAPEVAHTWLANFPAR
jgi:hypothetical protein